MRSDTFLNVHRHWRNIEENNAGRITATVIDALIDDTQTSTSQTEWRQSGMKHLLLCAFLISLALVASASAQTPDPTGKGRYMQFGSEVLCSDFGIPCSVVKTLPAGAKCGPAGELARAGLRFWNSTGEGYMNEVRLLPAAKVAIAPDNSTFLCECAGGYNQIFRKVTTEASSPTQNVGTVPVQSYSADLEDRWAKLEQAANLLDGGEDGGTSIKWYHVGGAGLVIRFLWWLFCL